MCTKRAARLSSRRSHLVAGALWCCLHIVLLGCCNGLNEQPVDDGLDQFRTVWSHSGVHAVYESAEAAAAAGDDDDAAAAGSSLISQHTKTPKVVRIPLPTVTEIPEGKHQAIQVSRPLLRSRQLNAAAAAAPAPAPAPTPMLPYPQEAAAVQRYLSQALGSSEAPYTIPTWFVVVVDPSNVDATNITVQQAEAQIALLNKAYATGLPGTEKITLETGRLDAASAPGRAGAVPHVKAHKRKPLDSSSSTAGKQLWQFKFMGIRYTTSTSPMCIGSQAEQDIKTAWRSKLIQDGQTIEDRTLILYVSDITAAACNGAVAGYSVMFGYGNTPFDLVFWKQHRMQYKDGVVIDPRYLQGTAAQKGPNSGPLHGASTGAQLVHEIGHWFGLVHTFEGGCQEAGPATDHVDDTPAEANPTKWGVNMKDASSGCVQRDSCGNIAGQDIVENYMTYNNLACANSFTAGQQARMLYLFKAVRKDR